MAVQLILTDVNMSESSITCSHNTKGLCSHLHSQRILHQCIPCLCIIIATEAANMPQTSVTFNGHELHSHQSIGRQ
jgi:hypothetical protein